MRYHTLLNKKRAECDKLAEKMYFETGSFAALVKSKQYIELFEFINMHDEIVQNNNVTSMLEASMKKLSRLGKRDMLAYGKLGEEVLKENRRIEFLMNLNEEN